MSDLWDLQLLYLFAEVLSCVSCLTIVLKLLQHRHESVQTSTVYWILVFFFAHFAVWTCFRALFYLILLVDPALEQTQRNDQETLHMDTAMVKSWKIIFVVLLSDVSVVGTSFWFLAMARELVILTNKAMTRGADKEKIMTKRYVIVVHAILLVYGLFELILTLCQGKYVFGGISMVALVANSVQLLGLVYVGIQVFLLKRKGRDVESVQGKFVPSPLYLRVRNLLIVYSVFSLQFLLCSVIFVETDKRWIIHLSTLFYRLLGVALALLVGCSQLWIVQMCGPCLPIDYVNSFASDSTMISYEDQRLEPPDYNPVFVFTDIESSSALWNVSNEGQEAMRIANNLHDDLLRMLLQQHHGYEITTAGDSFQLAFRNIKDAVEYCVQVQWQLLHAKWPKALRQCGIASARRERVGGRVVFNGLRVRMGIHDANEEAEGRLVVGTHPVTRRATYTGLSQVIASQVGDLGHGGQIVTTSRVAQWIQEHQRKLELPCHVRFRHNFCLTSVQQSIKLFEVVVNGLEARADHFAPMPSRRLRSCVQLTDDGCGLECALVVDPKDQLTAFTFHPRQGGI